MLITQNQHSHELRGSILIDNDAKEHGFLIRYTVFVDQEANDIVRTISIQCCREPLSSIMDLFKQTLVWSSKDHDRDNFKLVVEECFELGHFLDIVENTLLDEGSGFPHRPMDVKSYKRFIRDVRQNFKGRLRRKK